MSPTTPETPSATPAPALGPAPRWTRNAKWIVGILAAIAGGLGIWLVVAVMPGFLASDPNAPAPTPAAATVDTRHITAKLYYVAADGISLEQVNREVPYGATPGEQIRRILDAQIAPPPEGTLSAIPAGATVRTVFVTTRGVAYVDFGPEIAANHGGGSLDEGLTIYTIVNAVTTNLPDISAVQILVDGKDAETLAGHWDLGRPISRSLAWVRKGQ